MVLGSSDIVRFHTDPKHYLLGQFHSVGAILEMHRGIFFFFNIFMTGGYYWLPMGMGWVIDALLF